MYEYEVIVIRIIDGDTYVFNIDLGFSIWAIEQKIRLNGVSCPELKEPKGLEAKNFATRELFDRVKVTVKTKKNPDRTFDRYVADVFANGNNLGDLLVMAGLGERK